MISATGKESIPSATGENSFEPHELGRTKSI